MRKRLPLDLIARANGSELGHLGADHGELGGGQGLERVITDYWHVEDIRDLYKNDIKELRKMKAWTM